MTYDKPAIASALELTGQLEDKFFSKRAKPIG